MNIIRNIEGATLLAVGAFCAAAVTSIVLHSARVLPDYASSNAQASIIQLPAIVVVGKRLGNAAKSGLVGHHVAG
jgi:hypothetical protein